MPQPNRSPNPAEVFLVVQEGGSSGEFYIHWTNAEEEAREVVSAMQEASYNTRGPYKVALPAEVQALDTSVVDALLNNIGEAIEAFAKDQ